MRIGRAAWKTDTGRRRMRNEDAYVFEPPLFAIADGMGGARAGEVAAGIAATALRDERLGVVDEASLEATIAEACFRSSGTMWSYTSRSLWCTFVK